MLLSVRHETIYRYSGDMRYIVQNHRLHPSENNGQKIISWNVTVEGADFGSFIVDGGGDTLRTMTVLGPVDHLSVIVEGEVETTDTAGILTGHQEVMPPLSYIRKTPSTEITKTIRSFAKKALDGMEEATELDRAHALARAVAKKVTYRTGSTQEHTTAHEALKQGEGVCQDHAHILIATARSVGMPARYITGYLNAFSEDAGQSEASHAWAEIYTSDLGWVGFDASNGNCPNEHYIRVGSGLDALDAAPIRGISVGLGVEAMDVSVEVQAAQQ